MGLFRNLADSFSWRLVLVFVLIGATAALVTELLTSDYDSRGFVESADGLRLAYEIQGEGFALVTLAGGPGISHHGFHPFLGRLKRDAMLVYFDPRGRGESDPAPSYAVESDVRDIEVLRRGLELERIDLLGVSYGAHLAVAYALEHPGRVRKMILVSPLVGRSAWKKHLQMLMDAPGMEKLRGRRLADLESRERIIRTLLPLYWCHPSDARKQSSPWRHRHRIAWQNIEVYEDIVGRPFGELNGDLASSEVGTRLGEIEAPVLLIQGDCDRILPDNHVAWLSEQVPRAQVVHFPDAGHSPFVDRPQRFAEHVVELLAKP
jgi:proline iminopeptidase